MNAYDDDMPGFPVNRAEAAELLRSIRAGDDTGHEAIDTAWVVMPDHPPVLRLRVESLLERGLDDEADALIARGLIDRPTDAALGLLRVRRLVETDRLDAAEAELRLVMARRPEHGGVRRLAAKIAARRGRFDEAILHLEVAHRHRPTDDSLAIALVEALLSGGEPARAAAVVSAMGDAGATLRARTLAARGRLEDARSILEAALAEATDVDVRDELLCHLCDLAEQSGDASVQGDLIERIDATTPRADVRAGRLHLARGEYEPAAARVVHAARCGEQHREALAILATAATFADRRGLAERAVRRMNELEGGIDRATVAAVWRRGMLGAILAAQRSPDRAGGDAMGSVARPMLEHAAGVLERAAGRAEGLDRIEFVRLRGGCREGLRRIAPASTAKAAHSRL